MKSPLNVRRDRLGFTLIELIVVLMILVGLAGILIPAVTDMVGRTHTSTASANFSETSNAIQRYETQYFQYPGGLDSLMTALTAGSHITTLDGEIIPGGGGDHELVPVTLTTETAAALEDALGNVALHGAATASTFDLAVPGTVPADTNVLLGLSTTEQVGIGLETVGVANKYVVLGVGAASAMNGTVMVDAPVHFPEGAEGNPAAVYGRFLAVFQILNADGSEALERARFVGMISPHGTPQGAAMGEYFEIAGNG